MHAKLPAMMIARKIQRITISAKPLTSYPVRSASSSLIVGRNVNVKIVASTADQTISRKNAGQGTPGRRDVASSTASGDVTAPFRGPHTSCTIVLFIHDTEPTETTR